MRNKYEEFQEKKYENPDYWSMMDLSHGIDSVVKKLTEILSSGSVFEFGAWRGRNAIPLAEMGYRVYAQDVAEKPISDLIATSRQKWLDILVSVGDANKQLLTENYDAFLCLRVLHFMETTDAWTVLENMKSHTKSNWCHALVIFTDKTPHGPTNTIESPFFPSVEEIKEFYSDWKVMFEEVSNSDSTKTTCGKSMTRVTLLLRSPS